MKHMILSFNMKGDLISDQFLMLWFQKDSLDTVGFRTFRTFFLFLWLFLRFLIFLCYVFRCGGRLADCGAKLGGNQTRREEEEQLWGGWSTCSIWSQKYEHWLHFSQHDVLIWMWWNWHITKGRYSTSHTNDNDVSKSESKGWNNFWTWSNEKRK